MDQHNAELKRKRLEKMKTDSQKAIHRGTYYTLGLAAIVVLYGLFSQQADYWVVGIYILVLGTVMFVTNPWLIKIFNANFDKEISKIVVDGEKK